MLLTHGYAYEAFRRAEAELERLERCSFAPDEIAALQREKLKRLWERAVTAPYYERLAGSNASKFTSLPVTPKSVVRSEPTLFLIPSVRCPAKYYETSGTSGLPLSAPRFAEDIISNTISVASAWKRILKRADRVASLLPSDVSPIGDLVSSVCEYLGVCMLRCYPFALGVCDWDRLVDLFARYQPTCVFAAPGVLVQFMRVLKQRRRFDSAKASITTIALLGEVSNPALRQMLAANWEARVYDASYGSTETGTTAATCEAGRLHALAHSFILEVATVNGVVPMAAGLRGEFIVTPLNSYARALLRYASGDVVEIAEGSACSCGLPIPVLKVAGRKEDFVEVKGAALDLEAVERMVYGFPGITGYMLEIASDGKRVRLLLEKDVDFSPDQEERIKDTTRKLTAAAVFDEVVLVNQLPTVTKSGAGQKNWKKTNVRVLA